MFAEEANKSVLIVCSFDWAYTIHTIVWWWRWLCRKKFVLIKTTSGAWCILDSTFLTSIQFFLTIFLLERVHLVRHNSPVALFYSFSCCALSTIVCLYIRGPAYMSFLLHIYTVRCPHEMKRNIARSYIFIQTILFAAHHLFEKRLNTLESRWLWWW